MIRGNQKAFAATSVWTTSWERQVTESAKAGGRSAKASGKSGPS